jgi:hypothetical protein
MANRETQVPLQIVKFGSPHVRATQVAEQVVLLGNPKVRLTQACVQIILPNVPNQIVPTGPLIPIMEFVMP